MDVGYIFARVCKRGCELFGLTYLLVCLQKITVISEWATRCATHTQSDVNEPIRAFIRT